MKYLLMIILSVNVFYVFAGNMSKVEKYFEQRDITPYELVVDDLEKKFNSDFKRVEKYLLDNSNKNSRSQYLLGMFYSYITDQPEKGLKLLEKSAKSGYLLARKAILPAKLALLSQYTSSKFNFEKAIKLANNIQKERPKDSFEFLGIAYYRKKQVSKAIYFFHKAARLKSDLAFYYLGNIYMYGQGIPKNIKLGERYFKEAAKLGSPAACFYLSMFYLKQCIGKQKEGLYYLEKAASLDFHVANYFLGYYYYTGKFYKKDFKKAFYHFRESAKFYYAPAYIALGRMYLNGTGTKRNITKAFEYFSSVADRHESQGLIMAANLVIKHFDKIKNTEKNYVRAKYWLKIALKTKRKTYAYYLLGVMHFEGKGFAKNEKKALRMFKEACKHYNPKIFNTVAYYLAQKGKYLGMALNLIKEIERRNQLNGYYINTYGYVLLKQKKYKQALTQLLKADKLQPNTPVTLDHLGDTFFALDKIEEAKRYWTKAILLVKNDNKFLREIKAKLIKLKNK